LQLSHLRTDEIGVLVHDDVGQVVGHPELVSGGSLGGDPGGCEVSPDGQQVDDTDGQDDDPQLCELEQRERLASRTDLRPDIAREQVCRRPDDGERPAHH